MPGGIAGIFAWAFVIAHVIAVGAMVATFVVAALDPLWETVSHFKRGHGH